MNYNVAGLLFYIILSIKNHYVLAKTE